MKKCKKYRTEANYLVELGEFSGLWSMSLVITMN